MSSAIIHHILTATAVNISPSEFLITYFNKRKFSRAFKIFSATFLMREVLQEAFNHHNYHIKLSCFLTFCLAGDVSISNHMQVSDVSFHAFTKLLIDCHVVHSIMNFLYSSVRFFAAIFPNRTLRSQA